MVHGDPGWYFNEYQSYDSRHLYICVMSHPSATPHPPTPGSLWRTRSQRPTYGVRSCNWFRETVTDPFNFLGWDPSHPQDGTCSEPARTTFVRSSTPVTSFVNVGGSTCSESNTKFLLE